MQPKEKLYYVNMTEVAIKEYSESSLFLFLSILFTIKQCSNLSQISLSLIMLAPF